MAVKCLSTGLKLFESRRELERRRQNDRNRDEETRGARRGVVGMAGGRGGAALLVVGKVEEREIFPPSTGFPPRPLFAISGIHVYTHTYPASCSCDLEPEPTN